MESAIANNSLDLRGNSIALLLHRVTLCDLLLQWADRYRWWLFTALLGVYLAGFNGQWRMQPDAALYLSLGRNLAEGKGFTYLGQPHHLVYPGWPWLLAVTFRVFGSDSLLPAHVLILLIAIISIALTYRLFLLHCGRPTAVIVAVGLGMTKTFYAYGFELWSDMPFTLGVMAFLAGYEAVWPSRDKRAASDPPRQARWYDWALLAVGLAAAVVTRPTMWPLLIAIVGTAVYAAFRGHLRWQRLLGGIAIVVIIAAAGVALGKHRASFELDGEYERYAVQQASHLSQTLAHAATRNLVDLLQFAASDTLFQVRFGHFNILFSLLVIALGLGLFRQRVLWGLWFTALLLIIFLVLPLDRYFLPVIPLLVFAWWNLLVWINRALPKPWGNLAFAFCFCFAIGMNASKVGGIIMQQRSRPFLAHYDRGQYVAVPAMVAEIGNRVGDDGVVLIKPPYAHITEFLSRRRVVNGFAMTPQSLAGHHVYVVEPTDADIDGLLQRAKRVVGPAVWQSGANLSLHETSAAVGSPATP